MDVPEEGPEEGRVNARMSSKKVCRVRRLRRISSYFLSIISRTVWNKKAKRFRVSRSWDKYFFPWPKLCSRWYPLFFSMLLFSFSIFQRARPSTIICFTFLSFQKIVLAFFRNSLLTTITNHYKKMVMSAFLPLKINFRIID